MVRRKVGRPKKPGRPRKQAGRAKRRPRKQSGEGFLKSIKKVGQKLRGFDEKLKKIGVIRKADRILQKTGLRDPLLNLASKSDIGKGVATALLTGKENQIGYVVYFKE